MMDRLNKRLGKKRLGEKDRITKFLLLPRLLLPKPLDMILMIVLMLQVQLDIYLTMHDIHPTLVADGVKINQTEL